MDRSLSWLLSASFLLASCEPVEAPQESPKAAVPVGASAPTAPAQGSLFDDDELDFNALSREALSLDDDEIAQRRAAALAGAKPLLERHLVVLYLRQDLDALRSLTGPIVARGDEALFGLLTETMIGLAAGEPGLLYRLASTAHGAGFGNALLQLADYARMPETAVDPYDLLRIGELVRTLQPDASFQMTWRLGHLYATGAPELGIAADPRAAADLYDAAASAGDGRAVMMVARAFRNGDGVARDLRRAHELYTHAGDKGDPDGHNTAAWVATTCPGFTASDHARALPTVRQSIAEHGEDPANLDTLAAVYARLGRFDEAIAAQRRAMASLGAGESDEDRLARFEARLARYRARQAFDNPDC